MSNDMAPTSAPTSAFFCNCLLAGLRSGEVPSVGDAEYLNSSEAMALLRPLIQFDDLEWLLPAISRYDDQRTGLYVGLLRTQAERPEVQQALRSAWSQASPRAKSHLMWRILDDPDLPLEWHSRLLEYVMAEWDMFRAGVVKYLGPEDEQILARAIERFAGRDFPESKKWVYLCSASNATRFPASVELLLRTALTTGNAFTREVAQRLLDREDQA